MWAIDVPETYMCIFSGGDAFSSGEGVTLKEGDVVEVRFEGFGRPLRNPVILDRSPQKTFAALPL